MAEEFRLASSAFSHNGKIPRNGAPPLEWYNVPEGTKSLALVVDDPDAADPNTPLVPWLHWLLVNIPPTVKGIPAGLLDGKSELEIQEGYNDFKLPIGNHRYVFKLYALDTELHLDKATKDKVADAIQGHVLGEAELIGYYSKEKFASYKFTKVSVLTRS